MIDWQAERAKFEADWTRWKNKPEGIRKEDAWEGWREATAFQAEMRQHDSASQQAQPAPSAEALTDSKILDVFSVMKAPGQAEYIVKAVRECIRLATLSPVPPSDHAVAASGAEPVAWVAPDDLAEGRAKGQSINAWPKRYSNADLPLYASPIARQQDQADASQVQSMLEWLPDVWETIIIENIEGCYSIEIDQMMAADGCRSLLDAFVAALQKKERDSMVPSTHPSEKGE